MAFIATIEKDGVETQIGVGRYAINPDAKSCEMAVVVADAWQGKGLASAIFEELVEQARRKRLERMDGVVLAENQHMLAWAKRHGFGLSRGEEPDLVYVSKRL